MAASSKVTPKTSSGKEVDSGGKKGRRRKKSPAFLILFLLLVFLVLSSGGNLRQIWAMYQQRAELQEIVAALEEENEELAGKVKQMKGDKWVEETAREKLGLIKPGEIVYVPMVKE